MKSVGAFEAKTHLSALLERVAAGETIEITRRGVAVARLVPAGPRPGMSPAEAGEALRAFRRGRRASRAEIRQWVNEGREGPG